MSDLPQPRVPEPDVPNAQAPLRWEYAAVLGVLTLWVFMLSVKIGTGLIAGLAVFSLTRFARRFYVRLFLKKAAQAQHPVSRTIYLFLPTWLTTLTVIAALVLIILGLGAAVRFVIESVATQGPQLAEEAIRSLNTLAASLPEEVRSKVPGSAKEFFDMARHATGDLMGYAKNFGGASFFVFLQLVFALILGVSAALMTRASVAAGAQARPLAHAWVHTMEGYVRCFTLLMGAQVYVSIWNTFCTAVFIYGILPAFDVVLPFRELLLMFTSIASLIPAAGNIMANTLILVLTIRFGPWVSLGSVVYLFVIHKLEYFVNGYIIGRNVQASVPEMLIAIILGEVAFGLPGLITAPVTYAFLKMHWQKWGWV
ncbi:AI-2E family transporter [Limnobacter humi]|uniref:AI-2E family transporter n=1 Tax=Limnobacter humi TaxID=1778671 RepID=A0ABT1WKK5_9BURK|nr:AI-2E family transporter [Limnobacter humi]MCQ8897726.1 AI-2E family transporter [Limnobacter humi]